MTKRSEFMKVINAYNVNDAWRQAKQTLNECHFVRPSRIGEVWEYPAPVTTCYGNATERVLFDPLRDANPFFHLFEGLWMLAGRQDITWLSQFNKRVWDYSDDGKTWHDAYGYRWREYFDMLGGGEEDFPDQLPKIVRMLRKSPDERRAVLQAWDPVGDLERPDLKAVPCNTNIYFKIRDGRLTMTVCCRSNDIVFGCYGSNAVHMSMLMEYMAAMIGVPVGTYYQVSDSWHAYTERWEKHGGLVTSGAYIDQYSTHAVAPFPMVADTETWDKELQEWMNWTTDQIFTPMLCTNPFFSQVASPLFNAWRYYKVDDLEAAIRALIFCRADDWGLACREWLMRRWDARRRKAEPVTELSQE